MTSSPTENEAEETDQVRSKSDFSIDHILNRAGNSASARKAFENSGLTVMPFPWLHCTRYCPPKIPRNQKKEAPQRRQLGRHPRIPFTNQQLAVLEEKFRQTPYLSSTEVTKISKSLQLADIRVKIWFQNRRARERRERTQFETERKSFNTSNTVTSTQLLQEFESSTSQTSRIQDNTMENKNTNSLIVAPVLPGLQNCSIIYEQARSSLILNAPKPYINDDSS